MAEVALRPRARADVRAITSYTLKTWGRAQARRYARALDGTMKQLAKAPELGRRIDIVHEGLQVCPSGRHPIFYLVTSEGIDVVRVLHEKRDAELALNRR